jgi:predicted RNase H-like nuclease (RuvC/YqgF family)
MNKKQRQRITQQQRETELLNRIKAMEATLNRLRNENITLHNDNLQLQDYVEALKVDNRNLEDAVKIANANEQYCRRQLRALLIKEEGAL